MVRARPLHSTPPKQCQGSVISRPRPLRFSIAMRAGRLGPPGIAGMRCGQWILYGARYLLNLRPGSEGRCAMVRTRPLHSTPPRLCQGSAISRPWPLQFSIAMRVARLGPYGNRWYAVCPVYIAWGAVSFKFAARFRRALCNGSYETIAQHPTEAAPRFGDFAAMAASASPCELRGWALRDSPMGRVPGLYHGRGIFELCGPVPKGAVQWSVRDHCTAPHRGCAKVR